MPVRRSIFSARTDWDPSPNRLSLLLSRLRAAQVPLFDLTESNPTHCGLAYPVEEITSLLANPASLRYDPDANGMLVAREAVAADYR